MTSAVISGTGIYCPPHVISNEELVDSFNRYVDGHNAQHAQDIASGARQALPRSSVEFIEKNSGIRQRHVLDRDGVLDPSRMYPRFPERQPDQLSLMAEIAVHASRQAMAQAGKTADDIDAVLCCAANMQRAYPAMAIEIQQALGVRGFAYDMNVACSSATFGIEQACNAVIAGRAKCVLMVNPEITSAHLEWRERDCHFIFGDVCTAVIIERADTASADEQWEVLGTRLATEFSNNIRNDFGFMNRCEDADPQARNKTFRQEGRKVFTEVVPIAVAHIGGHLSDLDLAPAQLQRYWLHQANEGMNQQVIKKLVGGKAGDARFPLILGEYANTASAGSIIAFHHHRADLAAGDLGVICSFGAGYSVGSVVLRKRAQGPGSREAILHPLLHKDVSDDEGFAFSSRFSGQEFFLADHVVKGQRVLPAAAHLEIARAAVDRILAPWVPVGSQPCITLTRVVFASAAVADGPLKLKVNLAPDERAGIAFEVHGHVKQGPSVLVSQGRAVVASRRPPPRCDVQALRAGARLMAWSATRCYQAFSDMGLAYGEGHRTIERMEAGRDAEGQPVAIAVLALPAFLQAQQGEFVLHPGLLDGALQVGLSLVLEVKGADAYAGGLCLPYAIEQVDVFGSLPERCQVVARIEQDGLAGASCRLGLDVLSMEGEVRARVRGLSVRLLGPGADVADVAQGQGQVQALTLVPCWQPFTPEPVPRPVVPPVRLVVLHDRQAQVSGFPGATRLPVPSTADVPTLVQALASAGVFDELVWVPGVPDPTGLPVAVQGFRLVKALIALGHESGSLSLTVITTGGQAVGADEPICPEHAAVHGLMGSLAKEFAHWRIRLVDVDAGDVPAWPLVESLPFMASGQPLLHRHGQWYGPGTAPLTLPQGRPSRWRRGGVYVVLGGAGGLGEVLTEHLVRHHAAQVVWVGRRREDSGIAARCERIAGHGPRPHYVCADATDLAALRAAYEDIRARFGTIHGLVHATIQLQDNSLTRMDEASFDAVLSAKARVCVNAAKVFAAERLEVVLFFSSVQSLAKLPGQANYAAGCTFSDAHAHALAQARPDWGVKVVNWGYWGGVGVVASPAYRQRMAQAGIESIEAAEGMALIEQLLASPLHQVVFLKTSKASVAEQLGLLPAARWHAVDMAVAAGPRRPGPSALPMPISPAEALAHSQAFDHALLGVLRVQMRASGLFEGGRIEADAWRGGARSPALCDRWVAQSLRILGGDDTPAAEDPWSSWDAALPRWLADPHRRAQAALADACLRALPAILRGDTRSTDVIFPDSSMTLVEGIYKHHPVADYFNAALGESLLSHMDACLRADPSARFRIAEIGAGTGGTSALMFKLLRPHADRVQEYRYTDISKAFLLHARQHYADEAPYLVTGLLNVALPLEGQDVSPGVYDVVIATNVLHATPDIRQTLRHAKALLKQGGVLLLNEIVGASVFTHLTFGLVDGWWACQDEALRCLGAPALSPDGWTRALQDEGFVRIGHPAALAHGLGQQIVVAFSDGLVRTGQAAAPRPTARPAQSALASSLNSD